MNNHAPTLPHELIVEILLRLPVRSLLRFKSVCKSWRSLISNSQFAKSHHDLAAAPSDRLLLRSTNFYIESIDIESSLYDNSDVLNLLLPPPSPPHRNRYSIANALFHSHGILGSCRGLILLHNGEGDLILWNPCTGFHKQISGSYSDSDPYLYGFGYDVSMDDYLALVIVFNEPETVDAGSPTEIEFFPFGDYCWNVLNDIDTKYKYLGPQFRAGTPLNGALHWLVFSEDKNVPLIITFDLIENILSEIPLPHHLVVESKYELYSLRVMEGCLAVCCSIQGSGRDEIWVMKEYKMKSSWTMSVVVSTYDIPHNHFSPICITKDGGIFGSNFRGSIEKRDDEGKLVECLKYAETEELHSTNLQSAMYRESLLSLSSAIGRNKW